MPSPFPGMDPYLESPYIWPDFHQKFANTIHGWLNQQLPKPYYARLEMRPEVGVVEEEGGYVRRIIPDLSVVRHPREQAAVALAEPAAAISEWLEIIVSSELFDHAMVEIRDPTQSHHLVTLIEIVSPANKNAGWDRDAYLKKQAEVLASDANLMEIDLLRAGKRLFAAPELVTAFAHLPRKADYVVLVNRAGKRAAGRMAYQIFPVLITEPLPRVALPLRNDHPELVMDLQHLFQLTYDQGPYNRGAVDYTKPPHPPLPPELTGWAEQCLRTAGWIA